MLQGLPEGRRKFSIDDHLRRFPKALRHLYELGATNEVKEYTEKNQLYKNAIELYRYQTERLNEIMRLYADYLSSQSNFKEAGIGEFQSSDAKLV